MIDLQRRGSLSVEGFVTKGSKVVRYRSGCTFVLGVDGHLVLLLLFSTMETLRFIKRHMHRF
jgi:hypothetical protein